MPCADVAEKRQHGRPNDSALLVPIKREQLDTGEPLQDLSRRFLVERRSPATRKVVNNPEQFEAPGHGPVKLAFLKSPPECPLLSNPRSEPFTLGKVKPKPTSLVNLCSSFESRGNDLARGVRPNCAVIDVNRATDARRLVADIATPKGHDAR